MSPIYNQPLTRSKEYASYIMDAIANNNEVTINGNFINNKYIDNLPYNSCVEVPCLIDKSGISPISVGKLPQQLAALIQTNINVQQLTVEAIVSKKKEHVYHAAMLDPHTASELSIDDIWKMTDEMIDAHGNMIPELN